MSPTMIEENVNLKNNQNAYLYYLSLNFFPARSNN